jgi:cell division protein FtsL
VASGVAWIVLIALLLAGVVAMNVAVLRLNLRMDGLGRERAKLRADNAQLSSQVSSAAASNRIQDMAYRTLGLVPAQADQTTYVDLGAR